MSAGQNSVTVEQAKQLARQALQRGDHASSQAISRQLLSVAPMDPEALLIAAEADLAVGRFSIGRLLVGRALALAPQVETARNLKNQLDKIENVNADNVNLGAYLILRAMHLDYPRSIALETVGRCNANCSFCPHEQLDRKFEVMSDGLFEKVIRDARMIPSSSPLNFYLNVVNEPFTDKKIFPRIGLLNDVIPHATIGINTNFNVLPPGFFENLRKVRGISSFNISFNAANEGEYRETMRIDFHRTVANIRKLLEENRRHHFFSFPISLSRIATGDARDAQFVEDCKQVSTGFEEGREFIPVCRNRSNWLGQYHGKQTPIPYLWPCLQWLNISIHCNGVVPHCCMDGKAAFPLGDVNHQSLLDIYNCPSFRKIREHAAARESVYPCNTCAL